MKLNRKLLRKLIHETISEISRRYIVGDDDIAYRTRDAYDAGIKTMSGIPKIKALLDDPDEEVRKQGLELVASSGMLPDHESTAIEMGTDRSYHDDTGGPFEMFYVGYKHLLNALDDQIVYTNIEIDDIEIKNDIRDRDNMLSHKANNVTITLYLKAQHYDYRLDRDLGEEDYILQIYSTSDGYYGMAELSGGPAGLDTAWKLSGNYTKDAEDILKTIHRDLN